MNKQLKGFMDFVRTQGIVGLAIGLAIGTQVNETVKTIVNGLINPIVSMLVGRQEDLQAAKFTLTVGGRSGDFMWGSVFSALLSLMAISAVIYYVVKGLKLDKLDKSKDK